jgi:hypothetical protein
MLVSQRTATTLRTSKRCSVPTGLRYLRERNIADKAARQCRGDIGVYTDGSHLLVDVAEGDATASSSRKLPPLSDERADPQADASTAHGDRVNAAAAKMMPTSRIPHSPASPGNRSP